MQFNTAKLQESEILHLLRLSTGTLRMLYGADATFTHGARCGTLEHALEAQPSAAFGLVRYGKNSRTEVELYAVPVAGYAAATLIVASPPVTSPAEATLERL